MRKKLMSAALMAVISAGLLMGCSSGKTENTGAAPAAETTKAADTGAAAASEPEKDTQEAKGAAENPDIVFGVTLAVGTNPFHQTMQKGMEEALGKDRN